MSLDDIEELHEDQAQGTLDRSHFFRAFGFEEYRYIRGWFFFAMGEIFGIKILCIMHIHYQ